MTDASAKLGHRLAAELAVPISRESRRLADAVRARHGDAARAVVYYGSCLRGGSTEGIHDFYIVVDDYRSAYAAPGLAWANALLPPNVFYVEVPGAAAAPLRAKVAVVSHDDLAGACAGRSRRVGLWARFAQPVAAAWLRDEAAREGLVAAATDAITTAVRTALALGGAQWQPADAQRLWCRLFRATYAAEWRPERLGTSDALYEADPERYAEALDAGLEALEAAEAIERRGGDVRLLGSPRALPHPFVAKSLAGLQLAKGALTFGDWLPYALWKVERHSGVHLEASERQRRHPWLFAWPLVLRALRSGALR